MFDQTNQEYGIRVRVIQDATSKGPFRAAISCAVTGANLGSVEGCPSEERAQESGLKHARKFYH